MIRIKMYDGKPVKIILPNTLELTRSGIRDYLNKHYPNWKSAQVKTPGMVNILYNHR